MTGEDRILADRMWRDPKVREAFERQCAFYPSDATEYAAIYHRRFLVWAEGIIRGPTK